MARNEGWTPDDTLHDIVDGEYKGKLLIKEAMTRAGVPIFSHRVATSRDQGVSALRDILRRPNMPEGIEKWQIPFSPGGKRPVFLFITVCHPSADVPEHPHHNDDILRIVMSGLAATPSNTEMHLTTGRR